jgi:replicative DNA helicase
MAPEALINKLEEKLYKIAIPVESEMVSSAQAYKELMDEIKARVDKANETFPRTPILPGLRSGFEQLDDMLGGLQEGHCILLGARPSMGKTALLGNISHNVAAAGDPVGFITYEMTVEQLLLRAAASEASVSSDALNRGDLSDPQLIKFQEDSGCLAHLPIHYVYNPGNIDKLLTVMRKLVRVKKCKLIIIDYVNLIPGGIGRDATEKLGNISASLKMAAGRLGIPIIIACQLNRNLESRDDQRPQLSDLKQSGNLEQDADAVIFLHREIYFVERRRPDVSDPKFSAWQADCNRWRGRAEILLRKNRHGRIGESEINFNESTTKFSN